MTTFGGPTRRPVRFQVNRGPDALSDADETWSMQELADSLVCVGETDELLRPCVDCGLRTGNFCETTKQQGLPAWQGGVCLAITWVPSEKWAANQRTPLCTHCERRLGACHFCRKTHWCTPPEVLAKRHQQEREFIELMGERQRLGPEAAAVARAEARREYVVDVVP